MPTGNLRGRCAIVLDARGHRCAGPATVRVIASCIHGHGLISAVCSAHAATLDRAPSLYCTPCDVPDINVNPYGAHKCPIVTVVEPAELANITPNS